MFQTYCILFQTIAVENMSLKNGGNTHCNSSASIILLLLSVKKQKILENYSFIFMSMYSYFENNTAWYIITKH